MEQAPSPSVLKFGSYLVDLAALEVRKNGSRIRLQEKPLRVLALLAERQGQVVSREELKKHLWPDDTFVDFETGLNTAVSKLRDALSDSAEKPRYIETIPRRGYRFLVPVELVNGSHSGLAGIEAGPQPAAPRSGTEPTPGVSFSAPTREAPSLKSASRSNLWVSLAAAAVIVAGALYWLTHGHPAFSFRSRDSVLIADFENQTGDSRFDNALGTAFTVDIEQSRYANVFPRTRFDSVLRRMEKPLNERITPALGREICQRENLRGLVASSITRTGQEYALTAQLIDPQSGETVRSYTERSYGEDHILEALDVLSKEIREALGESLYEIHQANKPLPQVTTRSLGALQKYADGSLWWYQGRFQDATTLFKAAVSDDPGFAMAHAALGNAYYSYIFYQPNDGQREYEKALSLLSRTTDREHMLIETQYALNQNHITEAERLFGVYLSRYPDDATMRYDYADLLRDSGRQQLAIEQYTEALRSEPDRASAYLGIATAYKVLNDYSDALQAYAKAFEIEPRWLSAGDINREYGFTLVANGQEEKAAQVFAALLANPETRENGLRSLAFLDLYHGRYANAQRRLEECLELVQKQSVTLEVARVHLVLAIVAEGKGDAKGQLKNLDAASSYLNDIQVKALFGAILGDAYARAGHVNQAEKIAAIIAPASDRSNSEQMGYMHLLQGDIALSHGQNDRAIDLLKQSDQEDATGFSEEALAHAYQESGRLDQAIAAGEKMLTSSRSLGWEPQQRWLQARYALALDYLSRGEKLKARNTLAKLLNLWKDADPNLLLLKQAKSEYAKLQ
jgi:eukaryotic-like serine/threonine-protein kinase